MVKLILIAIAPPFIVWLRTQVEDLLGIGVSG